MAAPPPKPWERSGSAVTSISAPGVPKPWEQAGGASTALDTSSALTRPAERPWERGPGQTYNNLTSTSYNNNNTYTRPGMYGSNYGTGSSMYGSGGYGSSYGAGMYGSTLGGGYGNSMYGSGGYGSGYGNGNGMYGSSLGGGYSSSMYGGGMYGGSSLMNRGMYGGGGMYGQGMYGQGMGNMYGGGPMMGGPGGMPFDPNHPPEPPPTAWQTLLAGVNGVMQFFGRLSFLVDENAHAVHFFISALLQLLDRAGFLYAELARFIIRIIFRRRKGKPGNMAGPPNGPPGMQQPQHLALPAPPGKDTMAGPGALEAAAAAAVPEWDVSSKSSTAGSRPGQPGNAFGGRSGSVGVIGSGASGNAAPWGPVGRRPPPAVAAVGGSGQGWDGLWGSNSG